MKAQHNDATSSVYRIDPSMMMPYHEVVLWHLIHSTEKTFLFRNTIFKVKYKDERDKEVSLDVELTRTLIKYERRKVPGEFRYAVLNPKTLDDNGGMSTVYKVDGTLYNCLSGEKRMRYKLKGMSKKNPLVSKKRVAKVLENKSPFTESIGINYYNDMAKFEHNVTQRFSTLASKLLCGDPTTGNAGLLFRFLEGKLLFDILVDEIDDPRKILSVDERIKLSIMLCRALKEQIHNRGIIHRDVKPDNIMVRLGASNRVVSTTFFDLGFAKMAPTQEERKTGKRVVYECVGSRKYASPEAVEGELTDEKSDVFSLGVTFKYVWGHSDDKHFDPTRFFQDINADGDLILEHQREIMKVIRMMIYDDKSARPSLDDVINVFETIQAQRQNDKQYDYQGKAFRK